jgi:hypothetical protein
MGGTLVLETTTSVPGSKTGSEKSSQTHLPTSQQTTITVAETVTRAAGQAQQSPLHAGKSLGLKDTVLPLDTRAGQLAPS